MVSSAINQTEYSLDPDVQLMLRVKQGDEEAFTQLYNRYQERLIGFFHRLLQNRELAEDLVQEVFLRVYRARHNYQPSSKFSTWLFTIAGNLAKNSVRTEARRLESCLGAFESCRLALWRLEDLAVDKSQFVPALRLDKKEICLVVRSAVNSLTDRQRMAVSFRRYRGMSYSEIGAAMDTTATAVKSLLSRAQENLRTKLEPYVGSLC